MGPHFGTGRVVMVGSIFVLRPKNYKVNHIPLYSFSSGKSSTNLSSGDPMCNRLNL